MRRRTFLRNSAIAGGIPLALGGMNIRLLAGARSVAVPSDRVLVLVQLEGGNDGLNTVIPVEDDLYYSLRPTIAIPRNDALRLDGQDYLRMNPVMSGMARLYNEGSLAVVNNIGYDYGSLSHFEGTEIWNTASGGRLGPLLATGWVGRWLQNWYPEYPDQLPDAPPAIEIAASTSSVFTVTGESIAMSLSDPVEFYELVSAVPHQSSGAAPDTPGGREWNFIDSIGRQSVVYADAVRDAWDRGRNAVEYPTTGSLAASLAIIARLVSGGLGTNVYRVVLRGFDTHSAQLDRQAYLLSELSNAVTAFVDDTRALGVADRVVGITVSEFGRRPRENGSGSDHGSASSHFVFGGAVDGGRVYGGLPDLANLDRAGNLVHKVTFPCYYASVVAPLFGLDTAAMADVIPFGDCGVDDRLDLFNTPSMSVRDAAARNGRMDLR